MDIHAPKSRGRYKAFPRANLTTVCTTGKYIREHGSAGGIDGERGAGRAVANAGLVDSENEKTGLLKPSIGDTFHQPC